jgi:hypothetical protein
MLVVVTALANFFNPQLIDVKNGINRETAILVKVK